MPFFRRKKRPSFPTPNPTGNSEALAFEPPRSSEAHGDDRDSEEARILFQNLNIRSEIPVLQQPSPAPEQTYNHQPPDGFQTPSYPQVSIHVPSPPDFPSHPNFTSHPTFPSPPPLPPTPPAFPSQPNFPAQTNVHTHPIGNFEFSPGFESHSGIAPPPGSHDSSSDYLGPLPMGFSHHDTGAYSNNFPSSSHGGGDYHSVYDSTQVSNPVAGPLTTPDLMEPNLNMDEPFSHLFSGRVSVIFLFLWMSTFNEGPRSIPPGPCKILFGRLSVRHTNSSSR